MAEFDPLKPTLDLAEKSPYGHKSPGNDNFDLEFGIDMVFVTGKQIMKSKFQNFGFFAYFVTSQTLKMASKWSIININGYKTPGNDTFDLKFGMGLFFVTRTPIMK